MTMVAVAAPPYESVGPVCEMCGQEIGSLEYRCSSCTLDERTCSLFCEDDIEAGTLICHGCGEICNSCGTQINDNGPWDGGLPVFDQTGCGLCFECQRIAENDAAAKRWAAQIAQRLNTFELHEIEAIRPLIEGIIALEERRHPHGRVAVGVSLSRAGSEDAP